MARRTFINTRCLLSPQTGVQRFTRGLCSALGPEVERLQPARRLGGAVSHLWEQSVLPVRAAGGILLSPANTGPLLCGRQIVTIHDATIFDHPEWFRPAFARWYRVLLQALARRAEIVVTDSEFSKRRLAENLDLPSDRLHVVSIGVDAHFSPRPEAEIQGVRARHGLHRPYLLYVGSIEPRKNLRTLLEAWELLGAAGTGEELVLVGVKGHVFRDPGITGRLPPGVRQLGHVADEDLPALYSGSLGFVYPSLYEGFGLPVLEAMACGLPVVASRIDVLAEITQGRHFGFDPRNAGELAEQLRRVAALSVAQRREVGEWNRVRAAQYTWAETARCFRGLIARLQ